MEYLLIAISFIIHLLTFILIKVLYGKLTKVDQVETSVNQQQKQLEDTLAVYLLEIQEENKALIQTIEKLEKSNNLEKRNNNDDVPVPSPKKNTPLEKEKAPSEAEENRSPIYSPPISNLKEEKVESSREAQIYHLHDLGYSIDEIAKKLNTGKTEVALILKFHQKKE